LMRSNSCTLPALCPFRTTASNEAINYKLYDSVDELPIAFWDELIAEDNYVMRSNYLRAMEESKSEKIESRFVTIEKNDRLLGFLYLQIVTIHKTGLNENVTSGKNSKWREEIARYLKKGLNKIKTKVLVVGSILVSGMYGIQLAKGVSREEFIDAMHAVVTDLRKELNTGFVFVKDFEPIWNDSGKQLEKFGYQRVISQPSMEIEILWNTWDEYLADLLSKYRVRAKKIIKTSKSLELREFSLEDMITHEETIFNLYKDLISRSEFTMGTSGPKFFTKMKEKIGDDYLCYGYFLDGKLLGFLTGFLTSYMLESHFIGFDHSKIRSHSFYQRILQDFLRLAIDHKVPRLTYGRTAMEIKSTLGAEPKNMDSFMWANNKVVHALLPSMFDRLRGDDWVQRRPLKSQANQD